MVAAAQVDKDKNPKPQRPIRKSNSCPTTLPAAAAGEQGGRLADVLVSFRRAKRRMALIEGNPVDTAAERASSSPEYIANIAGIQTFLDDPDPRLAGVQAEFINTISLDVDAVEAGLDRASGGQHLLSRRHFRVLPGGRSWSARLGRRRPEEFEAREAIVEDVRGVLAGARNRPSVC